MNSVSQFIGGFQPALFEHVELCLGGPLSVSLKTLVTALNGVRIENYIVNKPLGYVGRRSADRQSIARAFVAKSVLGYTTTEALICQLRISHELRTLCGFHSRQSVPSSATFSRVFAEFAKSNIGETVHKAMVAEYSDSVKVENISRDSTSISAREKPVVTEKEPSEPKRKRGRPRKDEVHKPAEPTRLEKQLSQGVNEMLAELPKACDIGCKRNSKGNLQYTIGYKVHIDWACKGIPVTVLTTSASLHDSQVAIPLMRITSERIKHEYELMDAAYDSQIIRSECERLGYKPIIDFNRRRGSEQTMDVEQAERYKARSTAERGNSQSKDTFGFRNLRVRGHAKVHLHVMFGILSLFALQWHRVLQT